MAKKAKRKPIRKNHGRPIEILLVEDSLADIRLTATAFEDAKVRIEMHVVTDGEQAMDFLQQRGKYKKSPRPDLILLDLGLPKKDGREVLAEIKADEHLKLIPVVVVSTSAAEKDILESYNLNANCYITKPIDPEEFIAVVREINDFWLSVVKLPPSE